MGSLRRNGGYLAEPEKKYREVLSRLIKLGNEHQYHRARYLALDKANPDTRLFKEYGMFLGESPGNAKGWFKQEMVSREKQILKTIKSLSKIPDDTVIE